VGERRRRECWDGTERRELYLEEPEEEERVGPDSGQENLN
jgi:hypothetical protein